MFHLVNVRDSSDSQQKPDEASVNSFVDDDQFDWFGEDDESHREFVEVEADGPDYHRRIFFYLGWVAVVAGIFSFFLAILQKVVGVPFPDIPGTSYGQVFVFFGSIFLSFPLIQLLLVAVSRLLSTSRRVLDSLFLGYWNAVFISIHFSCWTLLSLILFSALFSGSCAYNPDPCSLAVVRQLLVCGLVTSAAFFLERLFIQLISNNFYKKALSHKILDIRFKNYVVSELLKAINPLDSSLTTASNRHTHGCMCFSCVREQVSSEISLSLKRFKTVFGSIKSTLGHLEFDSWELHSEKGARKAARDLFFNLKSPEATFLSLENFQTVFPAKDAAQDAFYLFDLDFDNQVSKREFRNIMVQIYRERLYLLKTIKDLGCALKKLDLVIRCVMALLLAFIYLTIFNFYAQDLLALAVSASIAFHVLFKDASADLLTCVLFVFNEHAFDVGDSVTIGTFSLILDNHTLNVHEIQLFQTIFKGWDGSEVYISNVKLYESTIVNHQRATEQWEKLELEINLSTSDQQLSDLRAKVSEFLKNNPNYYYSMFQIVPKTSTSMEKLQFTIKVKCKATTDSKRKWERHGKLLHFMRDTIESLGIVYYTPSG